MARSHGRGRRRLRTRAFFAATGPRPPAPRRRAGGLGWCERWFIRWVGSSRRTFPTPRPPPTHPRKSGRCAPRISEGQKRVFYLAMPRLKSSAPISVLGLPQRLRQAHSVRDKRDGGTSEVARPSAGNTPRATRSLHRADKFEIRNSKFEIPAREATPNLPAWLRASGVPVLNNSGDHPDQH